MPAPSWKRVVAFLIDYLIVNSFIVFPFNSLLKKIIKTDDLATIFQMISQNSVNIKALIYVSIFMSIMAFLYFVLLESRFNQTIGKIIMKIQAVDIMQKPSVPLGFSKTFKRNLSVLFLYSFPIVTLFDAAYALFNADRQRLFEKISMTKTVSFTEI